MTGRDLPALLGIALIAVPATAKDYGQQGTTFAISEPDLLDVIRNRLLRLQATGAIEAANRAFASRTIARVRRPEAVPGIVSATAPRAWLVDPSVTVSEDLRDHRGRIVVAKGTRVNPLDTVSLRQSLVFIDGDDAAQVAWARAGAGNVSAKVILVRGSPLELMKAQQRRIYFDQKGTLTTRLGIRAVPAIVEQRGRLLAAREVALPNAGGLR